MGEISTETHRPTRADGFHVTGRPARQFLLELKSRGRECFGLLACRLMGLQLLPTFYFSHLSMLGLESSSCRLELSGQLPEPAASGFGAYCPPIPIPISLPLHPSLPSPPPLPPVGFFSTALTDNGNHMCLAIHGRAALQLPGSGCYGCPVWHAWVQRAAHAHSRWVPRYMQFPLP